MRAEDALGSFTILQSHDEECPDAFQFKFSLCTLIKLSDMSAELQNLKDKFESEIVRMSEKLVERRTHSLNINGNIC